MYVETKRHMGDRDALTELAKALGRHEVETRRVAEEYAAKWTAEKKREAAKNGDALPDGSFPIIDQQDLENAVGLIGNSDKSEDTVRAHIKKQAKKHGLKLPASFADSDG